MQKKILHIAVLGAMSTISMASLADPNQCQQFTQGQHSFGTVQCADKSVVLSEGSVVLTATHDGNMSSNFTRSASPDAGMGIDPNLSVIYAKKGSVKITAGGALVLYGNASGIVSNGQQVTIQSKKLNYTISSGDKYFSNSTALGAYNRANVLIKSSFGVGNSTQRANWGIIESGASTVTVEGNVDIYTGNAAGSTDPFSGGAVYLNGGSVKTGNLSINEHQSDIPTEKDRYRYYLVGDMSQSHLYIQQGSADNHSYVDKGGWLWQSFLSASVVSWGGGTLVTDSLNLDYSTSLHDVTGIYTIGGKVEVKNTLNVTVNTSSRSSAQLSAVYAGRGSTVTVGDKATLSVSGSSFPKQGQHNDVIGQNDEPYPTVVGLMNNGGGDHT